MATHPNPKTKETEQGILNRSFDQDYDLLAVIPTAEYNGTVSRLQADASGNLNVNIAAGSSSGVQYTEGDTDASITGTAVLWEDGSDTLRAVSAAKPLPVNIISGAGSGGTAIADDAAFTVGTTSLTPVGGTYRSVRDSVNDNDAGAFAMTATRALYTAIETPAGDTAMDDVNDAVRVNIVAGSSSGVQYTQGDTDASITGTAMLMEGAADTLLPVPGTTADGLLVNLGSNNDVTLTGAGSNAQIKDDSFYAEDVTSGLLMVHNRLWDGAAYDRTPGDSTNGMLVNLGSNNDVTVTGTVTANLAAGTNNIGDVDVASITAGDNLIGRVKLSDGTDVADVLDLTNSNPLTVAIVDGDGTQITSFGGGTQYTEDAASAANPVGNMMMAVRKDTLAAVTTTDEDNIALRSTNKGELYVKHTDSLILSSASVIGVRADGVQTLWSQGSNEGDAGFISLGVRNDGGATTLTNANGDYAVYATDANGRVGITDLGGTISIDDGGGVITVDGSVTVSATNLDVRDIAAATDTITVHGDVGVIDQLDLTNSNPAAVAIVDGNGDQITSFGGGTQYTEADTDASITGTAMMMEGAANALVPAQGTAADGLLVNLGANNDVVVSATNLDIRDLTSASDSVAAVQSGTWNVTNVSGTVSLPTGASTLAEQQTQTTALQLIDDVVYTDDTSTHATGTSKGVLFMAAATPTDASVNANDIAAVGMTTDRKLHVAVMDALPAGTAAIGKLAANTGVDIGDVDVTSVIPGTGATNLGKAIDTATGATDTGVLLLATRDDDLGTLTPADADNVQLRTDSEGALWVTLKPNSTEGATTLNSTSSDGGTALTSTVQAIKASAGVLKGYYIYNPNASAQFVQFYNTASGSVTVGTTNPLFMLTIPASSAANLWMPDGIVFGTAMSWAATSTAGGNGAPGSSLDAVAWYK